MDEKSVKTAVSRQLMEHRLPAWDELPDFELYMDQVLSLCSRYLEGMPNPEGSKLTASMINNYVKVKIVPAPQGKRYSRRHVAYLLLLCVLKPILPIAAIQQLFTAAQNSGNEEELYRIFGYTVSNAKGKPTNSEFIAMIADKLEMGMEIV